MLPGEAEVVFGVKVRSRPTWVSWFMAREWARERRRRVRVLSCMVMGWGYRARNVD